MCTGHICMMPQRHLKCCVLQIDLLTCPLPFHSKSTENFSLSKYAHQPDRCPCQKLGWNSPPFSFTPKSVNFQICQFSLIYFQTWHFFFIPFNPRHQIHHTLPWDAASACFLAFCLQFYSPLQPSFHGTANGMFLKHLVCHSLAYSHSGVWSFGKISDSFSWFTRPCMCLSPSFIFPCHTLPAEVPASAN